MTSTPNYNDGKWHAWSGGECPVHPESEIEAVYLMNDDIAESHMVFRNNASEKMWSHPFLFRVVKEHREPREFWLLIENGIVRSQSSSKPDATPFGFECLHVREVIQ